MSEAGHIPRDGQPLSESERRQHERKLPEDTLAFDDHGRMLGRVVETSAGGMLILLSGESGDQLKVGSRMRMTVRESSHATSTMRVVVKRMDERGMAVEFGR